MSKSQVSTRRSADSSDFCNNIPIERKRADTNDECRPLQYSFNGFSGSGGSVEQVVCPSCPYTEAGAPADS